MINLLLAGKLPDLSYHECMHFGTLGFHIGIWMCMLSYDSRVRNVHCLRSTLAGA